MVPIVENYRNYTPPKYLRRAVERMVTSLPASCQSGLKAVVLSNSAQIERGKTERIRGRRYLRSRCLGRYHLKYRGEPPWIELIVDNIIRDADRTGCMGLFLHISFVQDLWLGEALFRQFGHHLEHTADNSARAGDAAVETWKERLQIQYTRKQYPCITLLSRPLRPLLNWLERKLT